MKRIIAVLMALAIIFAVSACGDGAGSKMTMGTGGTSGTYYGYGGVLGQYIKNNAGINVTVVSTDRVLLPETISSVLFSPMLCLMHGKAHVLSRKKERLTRSVQLQVFTQRLFSL